MFNTFPNEQFLSLPNSSYDNTDTETPDGHLSNLEACDSYWDIELYGGEGVGVAPPGLFEDKHLDDYVDYLAADATLTSDSHAPDNSHLAEIETTGVWTPADFGGKYLDDYVDYLLKDIVPISEFCSSLRKHHLAPWDRTGADGVTFMFGNRYLERAYRLLREALYRDDVCCLFSVDETPEEVSVTLCNTWKLTRLSGQARIKCEFRDSTIFDVHALPYVPSIRMVPVAPQRSLGGNLVEAAVTIYVNRYIGNSIKEAEELRMARRFDEYLAVERALVAGTRDRFLKRLGPDRSNSLSETTSKIIWKVLIDPDFFSTVAYAHFLSPICLSDYIRFARSEKLFSKLAIEDKKMLVLHDILDYSEFSSSEPFSLKRWTKTGVKTSHWWGETTHFFSSPAAVRALKALHPAMLRHWGRKSIHYGFPLLFEVLAKLVNEPKIPQPVLWRIIKVLGSTALGVNKEHFASLARLVRLYVRQIHSMTNGKNRMSNKAAIALLDFQGLLDWWCAEGYIGFPTSQCTWNSVALRAQQWHIRVCNRDYKAPLGDATWTTLLSETHTGEVVAKTLTTTEQLSIEGQEMQHCVGTYGPHCVRGDMQIFALRMPDGQRSTLSIIRSGDSWTVSQNLAQRNSAPAAKLVAAGKKIAALYSKQEKQLALAKK